MIASFRLTRLSSSPRPIRRRGKQRFVSSSTSCRPRSRSLSPRGTASGRAPWLTSRGRSKSSNSFGSALSAIRTRSSSRPSSPTSPPRRRTDVASSSPYPPRHALEGRRKDEPTDVLGLCGLDYFAVSSISRTSSLLITEAILRFIKRQWHRVVSDDEATARLERFFDHLHGSVVSGHRSNSPTASRGRRNTLRYCALQLTPP